MMALYVIFYILTLRMNVGLWDSRILGLLATIYLFIYIFFFLSRLFQCTWMAPFLRYNQSLSLSFTSWQGDRGR